MKLVSTAKLADMFAKVEAHARRVKTAEVSQATFNELRAGCTDKYQLEFAVWGSEVRVVPWIRKDWVCLTDDEGGKTYHEFILYADERRAITNAVLEE